MQGVINHIKNYIVSGHQRSVIAKKNILFSFAIKGFTILINLLLVPLTISYVNPEKYGLWLTISSIVAWFSYFDVGFGNGLRNKLAEAITLGKFKLARIYVSTTYGVMVLISILLFVFFYFTNQFIKWHKVLNTDENLETELGQLALIMVIFFCFQFVLQLLNTIVVAHQQTAKASLFNLLGNVISLVIVFWLSKYTKGSLISLAIATSFSLVVVLLVSSLILYNGSLKKIAPSLKLIKLKYARSLVGVGIRFFIIQIGAVILFQTNNIIISQLFGPLQVTEYNIAFKYFSLVLMVFNIIIAPYWSAFTEAWVRKDFDWIKHSLKKLNMITAILIGVVIVLFVLSNKLYDLWIGQEVNVAKSLSLVVAITVILQMWQSIYLNFLNGISKIKLQLVLVVFTSIINIPLSFFLGRFLGLYGVVVSSIIVFTIIGLSVYVQTNKILNRTANGIWDN